jgi:hypothetical protein
MRYFLIVTIWILSFTMTKAETLLGLSNIRIAPNKDVIIVLNDKVNIDCSKPDGDWYNTIIRVKATKINYEKQISLKKGDKLIDWNNKEIGIVIKDIPMEISSIWTSGGAPGNPERFGIDIYCCINKLYIDTNSIVENQVAEITKNDLNLDYDSFKTLIKDFKFDEVANLKSNYPNLIEYSILDSYYDAPSDRIRLIFDNNKLIAIVFTRKLDIKFGNIYDLVNDKKILILTLPDDIKLNEFIECNIKSYDSTGRD